MLECVRARAATSVGLAGHLWCTHRYLAKRAAYVDLLHGQLQEAVAKQHHQQQWAWASTCKRACLKVEAEVRPWRLDGLKTILCFKFVPLESRAKEVAVVEDTDANDRRTQQRLCRQLQNWEVRLLVSCCGGVFKEKFLRPNANAVRRRTTATKGLQEAADAKETPMTDAQVKALPPTPYYNSLVLEDCRWVPLSHVVLLLLHHEKRCCEKPTKAYTSRPHFIMN